MESGQLQHALLLNLCLCHPASWLLLIESIAHTHMLDKHKIA